MGFPHVVSDDQGAIGYPHTYVDDMDGVDPRVIAAPAPTRKKAHIVTQQTETQEQMMRRLIAEQLGSGVATASPSSIDDALASIDPADSENALKLFNWLRDNHRLHKVATLELQGASGYLFMYQEPPGSDREGYTAGATEGDRIVDNALEKAQASGGTRKGLCKNCFAPLVQADGGAPEADSPRAGTNPAECPAAGGGEHEFAG